MVATCLLFVHRNVVDFYVDLYPTYLPNYLSFRWILYRLLEIFYLTIWIFGREGCFFLLFQSAYCTYCFIFLLHCNSYTLLYLRAVTAGILAFFVVFLKEKIQSFKYGVSCSFIKLRKCPYILSCWELL